MAAVQEECELSEANKLEEEDDIRSGDDDDTTGTINCLVILDGCIIVGVDSRGAVPLHDDAKTYISVEENAIKFKHVTPRILITACKDGRRNKELWKYLDNFGEIPDSVESICGIIGSFLAHGHEPDRECKLFLAGYSKNEEKFIAYQMGDELSTEKLISEDPFFTLGCGRLACMNTWINSEKNLLDIDNTAKVLFKSLVYAAIEDPHCGGYLRVKYIDEESISDYWPEMPAIHLLDALLMVNYEFQGSDMLIFSKEKNYEVINYQSIYEHFERELSIELHALPKCLGRIKLNGWLCFLVDVRDKAMIDHSDEYYNFCTPGKGRYTSYRGTILHKNAKNIRIWVRKASKSALEEAMSHVK